ncbi:hypothetical protein C0J52_19407 [Blattella germanica]|nr:hypothetical protein C0J52_19407 [Blattella germanica]
MDICASNGIDSGNFVDSIESANLDENVVIINTGEGDLANEVVVGTEGEVLQKIVIPNRTLSTPIKSLVAAPRMPQQSAPRNTTQEEAAGVPSSVAAPSFVIPPHLMGRNVDNPTEDMIGSRRKLQKPRLGVRVPYRNLTSQIVTQDEIAQELLERSLKKHPVHDTPEGGDLFFAMKLTQRLANRLSPSAVGVNVSGTEVETLAGKSSQFQQNSDSNCLLPPGYNLVPETTAIPDDRELLAILEGEPDPDWMPDGNPSMLEDVMDTNKPPSLVEAGSSADLTPVHSSPPKLDPVTEREMALKQLMELPKRSKKKKTVETQPKTPKSPQKSKKRESQDQVSAKKTGVNSVKVQISSQDSENNNKTSVNGSSKIVAESLKQKPSRKRKLNETGDGNVKRPNMAKKRKTDTSDSNSAVNSSNKTDETIKKQRVIKSQKKVTGTKQQQRLIVANVNGSATSPKRRKGATTNADTNSVSLVNTNEQKSPVPSTSGINKQESSKADVNSDDEFSESMLLHSKKTGTPPKTYSPRKRVVRPAGSSTSSKPNTVAAMLVKEIGLTLSECSQSSSSRPVEGNTKASLEKISSVNSTPSKGMENSSSKQTNSSSKSVGMMSKDVVNSTSEHSVNSSPGVGANLQVKGTNTVTTPQSPKKTNSLSTNGHSSNDAKKKRMREIDRLLMDEGAINLLYEVEQGDSKRRSGPPETVVSNPKRKIRSPLKSVRRQKKDLLLKTRLVKNAVLRLSSITPSPSAAIALRARRRIGPPTLQLATGQNSRGSLQRKRSLDSRESLRSPPPLTPVDPPSPSQSFSFPPRLHLPAEASRIIRRHSSSSTFSSRSTSPNLQHRNSVDGLQSPENAENKPDNHPGKGGSSVPVPSSSKSSSDVNDKRRTETRKKGVPIFVRKPNAAQTYRGKKKRDAESASNSTGSSALSQSVEKFIEMKCKEFKIQQKQPDPNKKSSVNTEIKKKSGITHTGPHKKMGAAVKMKLKAQMSKNFQKGFQKGKPLKLKKSIAENKIKKKDDKKNVDKSGAVDTEMPDLTSCLAAVATEFAAEAESHKKISTLRRNSHDSSPCPSHGSKSANCSQPPPVLRKEAKELPPPLSPNASSYSNLIKTLETESQKPKKKDDEVIKQRSSVRQNAGTYHYKEICLRRYDNLVQIILTPASTKMKNSLNVQVLRELRDALSQLKRDDGCRVVLLTSAGSSFCQGIDFHSLLYTNADKRKTAAQELAQALKDFLKSLALFTKPLVAGVHGAAVGLGVTMLPFFDMVFASDKATFYTPYAKLGQTSELLYGCRKLTASEALHFGLVTRILWPDKFQEELIPIIRSMANQSSQVSVILNYYQLFQILILSI